MIYTITQAAQVTGKGRSTIHRAVKEGRLSAQRGDDGTYHVDASELARVFTLRHLEPSQRDATGGHETPPERDALRAQEVAFLRDALDRERETVADLRRRLDRAEERLSHHAAPPPPRPKGLLGRFLGLA